MLGDTVCLRDRSGGRVHDNCWRMVSGQDRAEVIAVNRSDNASHDRDAECSTDLADSVVDSASCAGLIRGDRLHDDRAGRSHDEAHPRSHDCDKDRKRRISRRNTGGRQGKQTDAHQDEPTGDD